MVVQSNQTIWYPGEYRSRSDDEYTQLATVIAPEEVVRLVRQRVQEDGEWILAKGFVQGKEDKLRKMMEFVSDEQHIHACIDYILREGVTVYHTVDWVCRNLANISVWEFG